MGIGAIKDKVESLLNKIYKISLNDLNVTHFPSWDELKIKAKQIKVEPGWAIYFVREKDYIDHIAIIPHQDQVNLNLFDALLLHAAPPPVGLGVGPLVNEAADKSGLRIITAIEYIELFSVGEYSKIFFGPPPKANKTKTVSAGLIAKEISDTGLIDGSPAVFSMPTIPLVKKFYTISADPIKNKAKLAYFSKKLRKTIKAIYCGSLVAEVWKKAGITDIPETVFFKIRGYTSMLLFKWSKENKSITGGLSWGNGRD